MRREDTPNNVQIPSTKFPLGRGKPAAIFPLARRVSWFSNEISFLFLTLAFSTVQVAKRPAHLSPLHTNYTEASSMPEQTLNSLSTLLLLIVCRRQRGQARHPPSEEKLQDKSQSDHVPRVSSRSKQSAVIYGKPREAAILAGGTLTSLKMQIYDAPKQRSPTWLDVLSS